MACHTRYEYVARRAAGPPRITAQAVRTAAASPAEMCPTEINMTPVTNAATNAAQVSAYIFKLYGGVDALVRCNWNTLLECCCPG